MKCLPVARITGALVVGVSILGISGGRADARQPTTAPTAAAAAVPDRDPPATQPVKLRAEVANVHPRLVFGPDDVERLRAVAAGDGKPFYDQMLTYLPACTPPKDTKFLTDATDAQRQGFWKLPTVALHHVLTDDAKSLQRASAFLDLFVELEHWETGNETDAGMGAANILTGVALAYDWLHDDLDPALRDRVRSKLLDHARRMYHLGHLRKGGRTHYWQSDPQNNHRWHRDSGLALAVLAVADEKDDADDWILEQMLAELRFVHRWLPPDGTSHESSSYQAFGGPYLQLAFQAADRCLGTDLLTHDYFRNAPTFRLHTLTPGLGGAFHYGDSAGLGAYNNYLFHCTALNRLPDEQAGLMAMYEKNPKAFAHGWMSLVWFDPSVGGGSIESLPPNRLFPDIGLALLRDGWQEQNVGMMFKSSPYGGEALNAFRNAHDFRYINVAHDDPDANSFVLYARGAMLADNDRYAKKKLTSSQNTILVNGKGQLGEGATWTQPLKEPRQDMTRMARVTAYHQTPIATLVEGEAAGAYEGLERYRRAVLWVPGRYVLILDDIRAEQGEAEIAWLLNAPKVDVRDASAGRFTLVGETASADVVVATATPYSADVVDSTAEHRGKPLGLRQLRLTAKTGAWQLATLIDAWNGGDVRITMDAAPGGGTRTIKVDVAGASDTWEWQPPAAADGATTLTLRRAGSADVRFDGGGR